ncbi:hypothetical protein E2320_021780 [Naja naja]|nr:hypothetical protein E2320_021780 [Naja naja]
MMAAVIPFHASSARSVWIALASMLLLLLLIVPEPSLAGRNRVKVLTDGAWQELLQGEWMVEFYAPWCPACQNLQPEWESFAEWSEDLEVNIAKVDVTEQPGLSGRFVITALPTIYQMSSMSALFQLSMWIRVGATSSSTSEGRLGLSLFII